MYDYFDLPKPNDLVVYNGTVCHVRSVDRGCRILTIQPVGCDYVSYVYAEDVDRFELPKSNKTEP